MASDSVESHILQLAILALFGSFQSKYYQDLTKECVEDTKDEAHGTNNGQANGVVDLKPVTLWRHRLTARSRSQQCCQIGDRVWRMSRGSVHPIGKDPFFWASSRHGYSFLVAIYWRSYFKMYSYI